MAELSEGLSGYLDVENATLRAPRIEATSNIGIANTNPQHAFSVGSNLYIDTESSDVLTVKGNVVTEGIKMGFLEITPSYDFAAVSNVGNITSNTIIFDNPIQGFVATGNATIGRTLTVTGFRITAAAAAQDDLEAITTDDLDANPQKINSGRTPNAIHITNPTESTTPYTGALRVGDTGSNGGLGVAGNVHVGDTITTQDLSVSGEIVSNLAVNTDDLFVDIVNSRVGIGKTEPTVALDVVGAVNASGLEITGNAYVSSNLEVGTANLFVDTVNSRVGIGVTNPLSSTKLETRGNVLFDLSKGDTIPTGLYNYMSTQLLIDTSVFLSRGTTTASTDIDPPPGVAGDVICKFINSHSGEAVCQNIPIGMPVTTGDTIYLGGWYYAPSTAIVVQHYAGGSSVNYTVGANGVWQWIERTVTATSTATIDYRLDNDTAGGTIYITGLTVRKNPSQTTNLPFTPRYSPHDGIGSVFTTQNIVAKEAAIRTLTGNVGVGTASPNAKLEVVSDSQNATSTPTPDSQIVVKCSNASGAVGTGGGITFAQRYFSGAGDLIATGGIFGARLGGTDGSYGGGLLFKTTASGGNSMSDRMVITRDGNVGIGTDAPAAPLQITNLLNCDTWSLAQASLKIGHLPAAQANHYGLSIGVSASHGDGVIQTYNQAQGAMYDLQLQPVSGNVGIGTTDPGTTLDVNGNLRIRTRLYMATESNFGHLYKEVKAGAGDITFTVPMRAYCNWKPAIVNLKASRCYGSGGGHESWQWKYAFRHLNCNGSDGQRIIESTLDGANPGTGYLVESYGASNNYYSFTFIIDGRNNMIAEVEMIAFGGIYF